MEENSLFKQWWQNKWTRTWSEWSPASLLARAKNPPANAEDSSSIPGSGRSPEEGKGNPLQYSCLGNPVDRGTWQATVHGVSKALNASWQLNSNRNDPLLLFNAISKISSKWIISQTFSNLRKAKLL